MKKLLAIPLLAFVLSACSSVEEDVDGTQVKLVNSNEYIYCPVIKVESLTDINELMDDSENGGFKHYYTLHSTGDQHHLYDELIGLNIQSKGFSQRHNELKKAIDKAAEERYVFSGESVSRDLIEGYNDSRSTIIYIMRSLSSINYFIKNSNFETEEEKQAALETCNLQDEDEMVNFLRGLFKDNEQALQKSLFANGDLIK